jgi:hypothetical protein
MKVDGKNVWKMNEKIKWMKKLNEKKGWTSYVHN